MAIRGGLSYPGGKWKALPQILPLVPDGVEDWREPFFGGGSVTLGFLQSQKSNWCKRFIVGDLAPEIFAYWKGTQESAPEASAQAKQWFSEKCPTQLKLASMSKDDPDYEKVREVAIQEGLALWAWLTTVDCSQLSLAQRAARTFITNRISFSGMGDSGSMSKDQFCNFRLEQTDRMVEVQPLLQRIEILNASFEVTMADVDPDKSFVFLDPPYIAQEKSGLYGKNGDTHKGFPHVPLANLCKSLPCKWLMTLDDSVKARKLYRGCYIEPFHIPYTMAGKTAEDALAGEEIFIANYEIGSDASYDAIKDLV